MQAIWLEDQNLGIRNDISVPKPNPGDALIRVRLAGICSTDLQLVRGYYPFTGILGHEFVGEVVEAPGYPQWDGQRVAGEINIVCGKCSSCMAGRANHCEQRSVLGIKNWHGAFAEYLTLPVENLQRIPGKLSDEAAVFVEPLAAALQIQEQVDIQPSDQVLVVGAGRLGQLIAQSLTLTGCELQVVARHDSQRKLLSERGIMAIGESQIPERSMDIVVDATGAPGGFDLARKAIRPRGTLVVKSTYACDLQLNFSAIVVDEITVIGSRCGPFKPAIQLLENGQIDPRPLVSAQYSLADGLAAIAHAEQSGVMKVLLKCEQITKNCLSGH